MKIQAIKSATFRNTKPITKPNTTTEKKEKNNITGHVALGLAAMCTAITFIRTDPTRIAKIANKNTVKPKNSLRNNSSGIEIDVKNFTNDKKIKSLDELSGLDKIKEIINEYQIITNNPEVKKEHNINDFSSLLFWGVTGTGKTTAAKGIAKKLDADFIEIDKEVFDSMWVSEGSHRLTEIIEQIETHANKDPKKPVVVFMDEIDGTISVDHGSASRHSEDLTNTLKKGMIYLQEKCENIIFIGATNKDPNGIKSDNVTVRLNTAILSRFKYIIEVGLPYKEAIQDAWAKLMITGSGKHKFTPAQNDIIADHFYKLGLSYRDITTVADKLNRLDAVQSCSQNGKYNSTKNLIRALKSDEKIGYDPVKKETVAKEKLMEVITSLEKNLDI